MPSFSRGNDGLDKEYFEELQEKCRFLGISLKEKDFRKNPDKYIEAARNYDERVKDYLHERQDRLKSLQEQFAREDNIPAFMALGKARMVLTGEVHRQMLAEKMAETAFAKIEEEYNFSVKDLHNKRNRDKFERLAYAFAISPQDLANQLQDAGNIGEALKNSDYQKEFLQLAFDNDAVKTAAEAMAAFSPLHPSNGTLMLQAARDEAGRIRFAELQAVVAENTAAATTRNAASTDKTIAADRTSVSGRTPVSDRTAAVQPENAAAAGEKKAAKLLAEFARYKDNQNGRSLLEQNAKALNKKANFVYLERTLDTFGLHGQAAKDFRMALSRHKGSLKDFLEHYEQTSISSRQSQTTNSASRNGERLFSVDADGNVLNARNVVNSRNFKPGGQRIILLPDNVYEAWGKDFSSEMLEFLAKERTFDYGIYGNDFIRNVSGQELEQFKTLKKFAKAAGFGVKTATKIGLGAAKIVGASCVITAQNACKFASFAFDEIAYQFEGTYASEGADLSAPTRRGCITGRIHYSGRSYGDFDW